MRPISLAWSIGIAILLVAQGCARTHRPQPPMRRDAPLIKPVRFAITAYCTGRTTAAGTRVAKGVVAADPTVFPLGTVIRVTSLGDRYNGTYTVMDTGSRIRGRRLDLYLPNCAEAVRFGRRSGRVSIAQ